MASPLAPLSLFAYGTLIFPEVWNQVTGDTSPRRSEPATLHGYAIHRVKDADFPGIVAAPDASPVSGTVYHDLDAETIARLDAFEDSFYERVPVAATGADGVNRIACHAYIVPGYLRARVLAEETWNAADFQARHLAGFIGRLRSDFGGKG